jgi:hypothetical protein
VNAGAGWGRLRGHVDSTSNIIVCDHWKGIGEVGWLVSPPLPGWQSTVTPKTDKIRLRAHMGFYREVY